MNAEDKSKGTDNEGTSLGRRPSKRNPVRGLTYSMDAATESGDDDDDDASDYRDQGNHLSKS